jgi:hypothetical protein
VQAIEAPFYSYADSLAIGHLAYLPGGLNPRTLPQNVSFPNETIRGVTFSSAQPAYGGTPDYVTCSTSYPELGGLPETAAFSRITESKDSYSPEPYAILEIFDHWLGNPAVSSLYPPCCAKSVGFYPYFYAAMEGYSTARNLSMGTTAGNYSFTVSVTVNGWAIGTGGIFHGSPLVSRTATAFVTLVATNHDCLDRPLSALSITPTFVHPDLTWEDANCTAAKIPLFLESDLSFAVDALAPGAPPPPTPEAFTAGVQVTCVNGTCPRGLLYFAIGAIPEDDVLRPYVSWSFTGGGCLPNGICYAVCSYKSGLEFGAPVYELLMPNYFFYTSAFTGFDDATPALLTARDWTPSTAFEDCMKDLFLVHGPSSLAPSAPAPPFKSSVDLVITAIRSDMIRITARNASLSIAIPATFDCPGPAITPGTVSGTGSVAKVVVPSVVVPVCAAAIVVAIALVVASKKKQREVEQGGRHLELGARTNTQVANVA